MDSKKIADEQTSNVIPYPHSTSIKGLRFVCFKYKSTLIEGLFQMLESKCVTELTVLFCASNGKLRANPVCTLGAIKVSGISSTWYINGGKGRILK